MGMEDWDVVDEAMESDEGPEIDDIQDEHEHSDHGNYEYDDVIIYDFKTMKETSVQSMEEAQKSNTESDIVVLEKGTICIYNKYI